MNGGPPGRPPRTRVPLRRLGGSPVFVTEYSFGGAPIGNLFAAVTDDAARAAVDAAWDGGIRMFDTAPHYGLGLSERRLGDALRHRPRAEYVISTKVGRVLRPATRPYAGDAEGFGVPADHVREFDFSADGVRRSLEASLIRLGLDRVDVALIHDPDDHGEQALREAYPALEKLRAQGCVQAIGVGMNQTAMLTRFIADTDIDVVLVAGRYTLLDRSAADELLPAALDRGISVITGGVFNSGVLAAPVPGATFDYQVAPGPLVDRARWLESICARFGVPLRAAAARFPLTHPAVASVLIGARSAAELADALSLRDRDLPAALWDALAETAAGHEDRAAVSIIDAHHHVWDLAVRDQPWITGPRMAPIRRSFSLADLRPLAQATGVAATVLVQTVTDPGETPELLALAVDSPLVAAVVGWADLTSPAVADELARLASGPGGDYLTAIRHQVQSEPDPDWLRRPDVIRGLQAVARAGMCYDLVILPHQLAAARYAAATVPELTMVLDHAGKPPIASGNLQAWTRAVRAFAAGPNTVCKLSGLVTEAAADTPAAVYRRVADVILDAFGPRRIMFGSDWPVCLLDSGYAAVIELAESLVADLSPAERAAVFRSTALRVYQPRGAVRAGDGTEGGTWRLPTKRSRRSRR